MPILYLALLASLMAAPLFAQEPLIAHWPFDEASGHTFADASGNDQAIRVEGALETYRIQSVACEQGRALLFSTYPLYRTIDLGEAVYDGLTVQAWIHPLGFDEDMEHYRQIVTLLHENRELLTLCVRGNGRLFGRCDGRWDLSGGSTLYADTWQHVAVTFEGDTISLYINGKQREQRAYGDKLDRIPAELKVRIGGVFRGFTRPRVPGTELGIDDIRIHGEALSAEQLVTAYEQSKAAYAVTAVPVQPPETTRLTITSYNVMQYAGRYLKERKPEDAGPIFAGRAEQLDYYHKALLSLEADIYVLQEAAYPDINQALAGKLDMDYRPLAFSPDDYYAKKHLSAGGILSRYPIKSIKHYPHFRLGDDYCQTRVFFRTTLTIPGFGEVMVYNLHLWPYGPDGGRIEQVNIYRLLEEERQLGVPQLLVGDFNRRKDSFMVTDLAYRGWRNIVAETGADVPGTWNVDKAYVNIDWILARGIDQWKLVSCEVPRNPYTAATDGALYAASDHLPVRATFDIPVHDAGSEPASPKPNEEP